MNLSNPLQIGAFILCALVVIWAIFWAWVWWMQGR